MIVAPDTSPRGTDIPDDPDYALGQGAGFYVNATQEPWATHYKMYDYVVNELPSLIEEWFPASDKRNISGHSMGGHGALMIASETRAAIKAYRILTDRRTFSGALGRKCIVCLSG